MNDGEVEVAVLTSSLLKRYTHSCGSGLLTFWGRKRVIPAIPVMQT